jgi:DNA-binding CsgD family transcriptional regulator
MPLSEAGYAAMRRRDVEMLELVRDYRMTNWELGEHFGLSAETIKSRMTLLRKRYGVSDRQTLAKVVLGQKGARR